MREESRYRAGPTVRARRDHIIRKLQAARRHANYWRKRNGLPPLTQRGIAEALGMSQGYISKIHSGKQALGFLDLELLAAFYGQKLQFFTTLTRDQQNELHFNNRARIFTFRGMSCAASAFR